MTNIEFDLVVIGGGPAGMAAASIAAERGLTTVLIDEQEHLGGQIYRSITTTPVKNRDILGKDYWCGEELVERLRTSGAEHWPSTTVWSISSDLELGLSSGGNARLQRFKHVILATGAVERPTPIEGWTLPGVMGAGGAQILLKSSGIVHDGVVIAGSGPLIWLIAAQYLRAGARIEAILDTTPGGAVGRSLNAFLEFLFSPYLGKGLGLLAEVRRRVKVISNVTNLRAEGDGRLQAVVYQRAGREERITADLLLLHSGVIPNLNLANATGCAQAWDPVQRCFRPTTDTWGASSVEGVSIAGDGAGILGAEAAAFSGRIAALSALCRVGRINRNERDALASAEQAGLRKASRGRKFLDLLYQPSAAIPSDATKACRCEEVTVAQIRNATAMGAVGPNQMKSFLRCGMGPCQGRLCGNTVTQVMAAERGVSPSEVGYYRLRSPVKPLTLAELASMPREESDVKAVYRN
jgi:NADPH-dependent 2,4-dienoyl-CoA reductase/sulfur reductase-like enzyme